MMAALEPRVAARRVLDEAMALYVGRPTTGSLAGAVAVYELGHWAEAYDRLVPLADQGEAVAAKLVLLMLRHGEAVYGMAFSAGPFQIARWAKVVLRGPRPPQRPISRAIASPSSMTAIA